MKKLLGIVILAATVACPAYAADSHATMTPQQRMKACGPMSKGMSKAARSAFMKKCLSKSGHEDAMATARKHHGKSMMKGEHMMHHGKSSMMHEKGKMTDKRAAQRQKMKDCNATAKSKSLKGKERKKFMSTCLKG